jgi:hypothetical protein
VKQIQGLKLELLPHPPYLPDLEPSDFYLFLWPLKGVLRGRHSRSVEVEGVKEAVHYWLTQRPKDFFYRGIYALVGRWRRRVERGGDDIED